MRTILAEIVSITFYFDRFVLQKRQISAVLEKYRQFSAALFANILPFAYLCSVFFDKKREYKHKMNGRILPLLSLLQGKDTLLEGKRQTF
jgi:hypothetical protein